MSRSGSPWVIRWPAITKFPVSPGPAVPGKCPKPLASTSSDVPSSSGTS